MPGHLTSEAWLAAPARGPQGEVELAGALADRTAIRLKAPRRLSGYALVYVVAGNGYYWDEANGHRDLAPGDAVTLLPGMAHAYGPKDGGEWEQIYFVFRGPIFDLWRRAGFFSSASPVRRAEPIAYWRGRLEDIVEKGCVPAAAQSLRILGRFLKLQCDLAALDAAGGADGGWLESAVRLLGQPVSGRWPRSEEVARSLGVGYETFRKEFARRTGVPPAAFQRRRRIERACAALYQGGRSMKHLADELGFADVFHFSKVFKKQTGVTPSAFRRSTRGSADG